MLSVTTVAAQSGGTFTITKSVIAGGGGHAAGGTFTIDGTIGQAVAGGPVTGGTFSVNSGFWGGGSSVAPAVKSPFDFDGDGKTDIGIYRPNGANGSEWWINRSSTDSTFATQFGAATDKVVSTDFTGDGKADVAFWRPSTGFWYVLRSEDLSYFAVPFGANGDIPVPADYDGDG
ncbi:MAG TPA: VCBS repeat-containing protein, partial [Pyrinomonadaceae bacterium]|nr:VCBS repeat-containing protein [Pyrinomonadaceae bacterium]